MKSQRATLTPGGLAAMRRRGVGAVATPGAALTSPDGVRLAPVATGVAATTRSVALPGGRAADAVAAPANDILYQLRSPMEERRLVGLLAPLRKLATPVNLSEAWVWDLSWRGADAVPRVSFYETSAGRGETVAKKFIGAEDASHELYDARDRLICGGGGCNPPFQTWFGWSPDPAHVYCNPDTLISVMLQRPRYVAAQQQIRAHLDRMPALPGKTTAQTRRMFATNSLVPQAHKVSLNAGREERSLEAAAYDRRVSAAVPEAVAANVGIADNAAAWAEWTMQAEALAKLAIWSTNQRAELLYDWADPTEAQSVEVKVASPAVRDAAGRLIEPAYNQRKLNHNLRSYDRIKGARAYPGADDTMLSGYAWDRPLAVRINTRWSTFRYPLLSTLWRPGKYDQGAPGELANRTDLPLRNTALRVPVDERHFLIDNTIPVPQRLAYGVGGGRSELRTVAFSGDGWGPSPGDELEFKRVPGITHTRITNSMLDAYVVATRKSYEAFFAYGRSAECRLNPYQFFAMPVVYQGEQIVYAPGASSSVALPSPARLVAQTAAKLFDIANTPFEGYLQLGMLSWIGVVEQYGPAGMLPQDFRRRATAAFQSDLDMAEMITGTAGGIAVQVITAINGWAGLVAAAVVIIASYLIDYAMESKMARGGNPLSIPMPMARYIMTDPQVVSECDYNPNTRGYDGLVPQVGVIAAAARSGVLDAVTLFGALGEAAQVNEVGEQKLPRPPKQPPLPYCT